MGDDISRPSNATSAARVAFSEGRPSLEGVSIDSETTTPHHEEPMDLNLPKGFKGRKINFTSLYDSIIYVKVGPENTSFGIHRALLCHNSSYFDRALNGGFKEAVEGEVILADEDPATFTRFNEWLYSGTVLLGNETEKDIHYKTLMNLYIFAEKRGVTRLQNAVIDCIIKKNSKSKALPNTYIGHAWNNTADSSPLHMLLVDIYVRKANFAEIMGDEKKRKGFDKEILIAFVLAFHRMKDDGSLSGAYDFWKRRCHYHVHNESFPPCKLDVVTGQGGPDLSLNRAKHHMR
ncbi:hypothetical protein MMC22_003809 [Lobaria immixta]|nr:hypothetical protein [Lobaria immixta]